MSNAADIASIGAAVVTIVSLPIGVFQLWASRRQAVTSFEDALTQEYRQITQQLPAEAMLGEEARPEWFRDHAVMSAFFRYFDLTNYQIFLRKKRRVSRTTWREWEDGIRSNMKLPAFAQAWSMIQPKRSASFADLQRLLSNVGPVDPVKWS